MKTLTKQAFILLSIFTLSLPIAAQSIMPVPPIDPANTFQVNTMYGITWCLNCDQANKEENPGCGSCLVSSYVKYVQSCPVDGLSVLTGPLRVNQQSPDYQSPVGDGATNANSGTGGSNGGSSSCGSCASGGAKNTLLSTHINRLQSYSSSDYFFSELGRGSSLAGFSRHLVLFSNGTIRYLNQEMGKVYNNTRYYSPYNGWRDTYTQQFQGIFLFDAANAPTTTISAARTAMVLHHDGSAENHQIYFKNGQGRSRLTHLLDRNGNAIQVRYVNPIPASGTINGYHSEYQMKSEIEDAYGRITTLEYNIIPAHAPHRYFVKKINHPNGTSTNYEQGTLSGLPDTRLTKVIHPDGSETSSTSAIIDPTGLTEVTTIDTAARGSGQKKTLYFSRNYGKNAAGQTISQSAGFIRSIRNGNNETAFHSRLIGGLGSRHIYKGGNILEQHGYSSAWRGEFGYAIRSLNSVKRIKSNNWRTDINQGDTTTWQKENTLTRSSNWLRLTSSTTDTQARTTTISARHPLFKTPLHITYPDGTTMIQTVNQFNQPLTVKDRLDRISLYSYSLTGDLLTSTRGLTTATLITAQQHIVNSDLAALRALAPTTQNTYNTRGQLTETRDPLYDSNTPELHNTKYEYNTEGYNTKIIASADTAGGTRPETSFTYQAGSGNLLTTTDPVGRTVTYLFDQRNRLIRTTYNDTSYEETTYGDPAIENEAANLVISRRDRNGILTTYQYDAAHRILKNTVAAGLPEQVETTYTYLAGTNKILTTTRAGEITTTLYDHQNRRIGSSVQANANTTLSTTTEYDLSGRTRSTTDPYGRKTYYLYDQNNNIIKTATETVPEGLANVPAFTDNATQTSQAHTYTLTDKDTTQLDTTYTHKTTYTCPRDLFLEALTRETEDDGNGTQVPVANAKYLITESVIDAGGQTLTKSDARGTNSWTEYDTLGRTTLSIQAVGTPSEIRSEQDYDLNSNVTETRSPRHFTEGTGTTANITGLGIDRYTYNGRNMRASHTTAPGATAPDGNNGTKIAEATQTWTYYLDGRNNQHTDFRGNTSKQIWHTCCGRLQASVQRDGKSVTLYNTDYKGQTTHTATVSNFQSPNSNPYNYHNPDNNQTLRETTTRYDGRGRPTHTTTWLTPLDAVNDHARISLGDTAGIPIAGLDGIPAANGLTTSYLYDEDLTDGIGIDQQYATQLTELTTRYGYNPFAAGTNGHATAITNPAGETTVSIQDGASRTILQINPEGNITTYNYDEVESAVGVPPTDINLPGALLKTTSTDANNNSNHTYTDAAGRTIASKDAAGAYSTAAYDANSNTLTTRDPNNLGTTCTYDSLNRPTTCADLQETAETNNRTTTYNAASQTLTSTNADGETTTNLYDSRSRLLSSTDPNNITTSYIYDQNNNLIILIDGKGNKRHWFFDQRNLNVTKAYPTTAGTGTQSLDFYTQNFDALGRVAIKVDQIGTTCTNIYDLAGRLTEKQYHTGATPAQGGIITQAPTLESTDTFSYDAASRIISTHKGRHNITTGHTYAADSMPLTETLVADNRSYTTTRSYDAANRPLSHQYPDSKKLHWIYNNRNLVTDIEYGNGNDPVGAVGNKAILTQIHDNGYRLTNQVYGNDLTRTINYNRQDNLRTSDNVFDGTQAIKQLSFDYTYAADKQITAETILAAGNDPLAGTGFTATYDPGNRISTWQKPLASAQQQQWNYDNSGNWTSTSKTIGNNTTTENRQHSVSDQITSIGNNAATHDHPRRQRQLDRLRNQW